MLCLEGLPGAGKSDVLALYDGQFREEELPEDAGLGPIERYNFWTQLAIFHRKASRACSGSTVMSGSLRSGLLCHSTCREMSAPERSLLQRWGEFMLTKHPLTRHVWVPTEPARCFKNLVVKGRRDQAHITLSYLEKLHAAYKNVFADSEQLHLSDGVCDNLFVLQTECRGLMPST